MGPEKEEKNKRKERAYEMGRNAIETKIIKGGDIVEAVRVRGGGIKLKLKATGFVNVSTNDGKTQRTEIRGLVTNPSNMLYARRGIITKGAIIKTPLGNVKVTSKPSVSGTLNGVLVSSQET
ncbi:MAG: 30S ribosomal protein S8e [Thermoproteota archaeon]